jgi:hypothetical protein
MATQIFTTYDRGTGEIIGSYEGTSAEVAILQTGVTGATGAVGYAEGLASSLGSVVNTTTGVSESKPTFAVTLSNEGVGDPVLADAIDSVTIAGLEVGDIVTLQMGLSKWPDPDAEGTGGGRGETGPTGLNGNPDRSLSLWSEPEEFYDLEDARNGITVGATAESFGWTVQPPESIFGPRGPGKYRFRIEREGYLPTIAPTGENRGDYVYVDFP